MNPLGIANNVENKKVDLSINKATLEIKNEEHRISKEVAITSRITRNGIVKYCNNDFTTSFGLSKKDNFNESKHPDMPNLIFKIIEHNIAHTIDSSFFIKNRNANGSYFWTLSNYNPNKSSDLNIAFTLISKKAHAESVYQINKLYSTLSKIEKSCGQKLALKYLIGFLEDKKMSFSKYNLQLASV